MSPRRFLLSLLMLLCMPPLHALDARPDLEVRLSSPASLTARESGKVIVSITNKSSRVLLLPRLRTPLFNPDDHLMNNFIDLQDANGKTPKFIGRHVSVSFEAKDYFYAAIQPGQTLEKEIDLAQDYDLRAGGLFRVSYIQDYGETDLYKSDDYAAYKSPSNELTIFVSAALLRTNIGPSARKSAYVQPECRFDQLIAIWAATSKASLWNYQAWLALTESIEIEEHDETDENGELIALARFRIKATPDYTFWFGEPEHSGKFAERLSGNFDYHQTDFRPLGVVHAVGQALRFTPFRCGCDPAKYDRGSLAWSNQTDGVINYCEAFFDAPLGRSSGQAITVIHEVSHLLSDPNLVTSDYVYGRKDAHALSTGNRTQATRNADNYNFYIEAVNHVF